jgi:hypothetical protein
MFVCFVFVAMITIAFFFFFLLLMLIFNGDEECTNCRCLCTALLIMHWKHK